MAFSEGWAALLEPGLRKIFEVSFGELAASSRIPILFGMHASSQSDEDDVGVGAFNNWREYEGAIEYDDNEIGWQTTYTHAEFARGFTVERKLVDDDQYRVISARPRGLGSAAARTREQAAANIFVNSFASGLGGDGVVLCSNSHPQSPNNAATQDNQLTTALSYAAVVTARETMRAFTDDRGNLEPINPNLILVPPELEGTANEIIMTMRGTNSQQPGTANYTANLAQDRGINYLVWDYLTDANDWWMIDTALAKQFLNWFDRVPLEFAMDPTSDFTLKARYRGYMRYSVGWSDWRWVLGHTVT